ncbi:hypothetical protein L2E82_22046 [Cichorium intybus]|uniref:Uncharacterized protein n=1 Tax=Cichorium intybus TaxID=13427 RepID=A0ACB9DX62_CICIN|nr:hypothetical protein L2E82_22046 [Cichorium intybus]
MASVRKRTNGIDPLSLLCDKSRIAIVFKPLSSSRIRIDTVKQKDVEGGAKGIPASKGEGGNGFLFPDGTVIAVTEEGFCSAPLIIESSSNVQTPNHFIRKSPTPLSRRLIYKVVTDVSPNQPRWTCRKKDIHPEFYDDAKVYCSEDHVLTTGGTKKEYVVDVWSGNHPFYLGSRSVNLIDADQVEKFWKKFGRIGGLEQFMEIPTLKGEIIIPPKRFDFRVGFPIVTFIDTLGAFADLKSEELGQA